MIYPLLAAVVGSITLIATKKFFNIFKELNYRAFAFWGFVWVIIIGLLVSPWLVIIHPDALHLPYIWLLVVMAGLAANYNVLYYFGLKYEHVTEVEPFLLFNPLITIIIASLFYADERSWHIYVAAGLAGLLLGWAHWRKGKLKLGKPMLAILGFAVLYGVEAVIIKQLLAVYSPVALYLVRSLVTALWLWVLEKGRIQPMTVRQIPYFITLGIGAIVGSALVYTSYHLQGISATVFILIFSPVLVYTLSVVFLKEKLHWRDVVADIGVVLLIGWIMIAR